MNHQGTNVTKETPSRRRADAASHAQPLVDLWVFLVPWWFLVGLSHASATPPQRIVCLAPSVTEMVFALGGGERVVAVSDYCAGPAAALTLPRVGGFANPNYERILALQPDLVLTIGEARRLQRFCAARSIPCRALNIERLADVARGLTSLGELLGRPSEAAARVAQLETGLAAVRARVADRRAIPTLLVVSRSPGTLRGLMTANGDSFLSELLTLAGGRNCFADASRRYFTPSQEAIFAAAPEVILELQPTTDHWVASDSRRPMGNAQRHRLLADWRALPALPAVRNHRLYVLTDQRLLIPGLHLVKTATAFARILHPEASEGAPSQ
jgi:iron complex transport system substrate-binding protein